MADELDPHSAPTEDGLDTGAAAAEPQAEEAAGSPPPPTTVTLEQVQELVSKALSGARQDIGRQLQSQLDKRDAGLRKQIEALRQQSTQIADAAKATGLKEDQAKQLGKAFFDAQLDALMAEQQQPTQPKGQGSPTGPAGIDDEQAAYTQYVTGLGDRLRKAAGLEYTDPEMKTIITDRGEQAYFDSIEAAGQAKAERVKREAQQGRPARSPGLGTDGGSAPRNAIAHITDPDTLYELAEKEAAKRRR